MFFIFIDRSQIKMMNQKVDQVMTRRALMMTISERGLIVYANSTSQCRYRSYCDTIKKSEPIELLNVVHQQNIMKERM